ncbi:TIGR02922 family protein [Thalassotalea crassostreae]|uniref:TIGR02922 family protein n=1 Tax=Thalassotalea crassostreae TaxID=1763536 RepID=UPI0008380673|nr:TIGR02922 family protein [Thalassotalea crassostreae]
MMNTKKVTVFYYENISLELNVSTDDYSYNESGRVIIPEEFKENRSIIAVCEGEVNVLNKVGDRVLPIENVA